MLTVKLKVTNQPNPKPRYAPEELRAIDRLVEKEGAGAKKMCPGKQFLDYVNKIALVPKTTPDRVTLSSLDTLGKQTVKEHRRGYVKTVKGFTEERKCRARK